MTTILNPINFSTPFLVGVPNSRVSPEWIRMFGLIVSTISAAGNAPVEADDLQTDVYTARSPMPYRQTQEDGLAVQILNSNLKSIASQLSIKIEDVDRQLPRGRSPASSANQVLVADDISSNVTMYPLMAAGGAGAQSVKSSSTKWTFNPSTGRATATQLVATAGFGCNGQSPQTAVVSGGALAAYGAGANGFDTAAHAQSLYNLVVAIRAALVANGIMS